MEEQKNSIKTEPFEPNKFSDQDLSVQSCEKAVRKKVSLLKKPLAAYTAPGEESCTDPSAAPETELSKTTADPMELFTPATLHCSELPKPLTDEAVTKHTTNMWKYQPIPEDEPEPFPEYLKYDEHLPGGRITAARVRGKKHKHEGSNCDDWFEVANFRKISVIAVSDGAGSRRFSRIGALESCRTATGYLARTMERVFAERPELSEHIKLPMNDARFTEACGTLAGVIQQAVIKAYEAVEIAFYARAANHAYEAILKRKLDIKDLSGTLLLAILFPIDEKELLVISCQVGDGMIAVLNTRGAFSSSLKLMGEPDGGEFSGETEFLTSEKMRSSNTLKSKTKIFRGQADTVLVMSDGVADDYFPYEPGIQRLYFDLALNGILTDGIPALRMDRLTPQQLKMFKKLPSPLEYPWVNDPGVNIALHYTSRLCEESGITLAQLWEDPVLLALCQLELDAHMESANPGERLKLWLDNYVVRGSFDDRTLVIAQI